MNNTEEIERAYLEEVKEKLSKALYEIDNKISGYINDMKQQKNYLYENKTGMDRMEKVAVRQSVSAAVMTGEVALERKKRIQKLLQSPYFGRFDFKENGNDQAFSVYIGIHAFYDENERENLIHDWRAPVSTLFFMISRMALHIIIRRKEISRGIFC